MILDDIVEQKIKSIKEEFGQISCEALKQRLKMTKVGPVLDVAKALRKQNDISIIAEIKPSSPSKGILKEDVDAALIAKEYFSGGADMISVLTEEYYFKGSKENLVKVRQKMPIPILRKDFIIDPRQIYQSRILGADAILLIVSLLDDEQLRKFQIIAKILGMSCIVEVHNESEVKRALDSDAEIIGINNRNLKTFEVSLETTKMLIKMIPNSRIVVSESGIVSRSDIEYVKSLGVDAVLVGEVLMKAESPMNKLKELRGG